MTYPWPFSQTTAGLVNLLAYAQRSGGIVVGYIVQNIEEVLSSTTRKLESSAHVALLARIRAKASWNVCSPG